MKTGWRIGVQILAILIAVSFTAVWVYIELVYGGSMFDETQPGMATLIGKAVPVLFIAALSQLGLFLAPVAIERSTMYRLGVAVLMTPAFIWVLAVAYGYLREVGANGANRSLTSLALWMPVVAIYAWQYFRICRGPRRQESSVQSA